MSQLFRLKNGTVLLSTEAPGGIYNSGQLKKIAELCSKELAIVKATEDQRLALFVKESEVEKVAKELRAMGLGFRHYQDALHQPVSCLGELCEEHEQPAMATAMDITKEIASIQLAAPLKIGINGCARCCTPCHTLDIAVVGDASGYRISLGGKTRQMPEFASYFAEGVPAKELPKRLRAVIETFKNLAEENETLHDVIERCGVKDFVKALAPYSQDAAQREDPFAQGAGGDGVGLGAQDSGLDDGDDLSANDEPGAEDLNVSDLDGDELTEDLNADVGPDELSADLGADDLGGDELSADLGADDLGAGELGADLSADVGGDELGADLGADDLGADDLNADVGGDELVAGLGADDLGGDELGADDLNTDVGGDELVAGLGADDLGGDELSADLNADDLSADVVDDELSADLGADELSADAGADLSADLGGDDLGADDLSADDLNVSDSGSDDLVVEEISSSDDLDASVAGDLELESSVDDLSVVDDNLDDGSLEEIPIEKTDDGSLEDDLSLDADDADLSLNVSLSDDATTETLDSDDATTETLNSDDATTETLDSDDAMLEDVSFDADDKVDDQLLLESDDSGLDSIDLSDDVSLDPTAAVTEDDIDLDGDELEAATETAEELPEADMNLDESVTLEDDIPEDLSVGDELDDTSLSVAETPIDEDLEGIPELDEDLTPEELPPVPVKAPVAAAAKPAPAPAPKVAAVQDDFGEELPEDMPELSDEEESQFEQKLHASIDEESRLLSKADKDPNVGDREAALSLLENSDAADEEMESIDLDGASLDEAPPVDDELETLSDDDSMLASDDTEKADDVLEPIQETMEEFPEPGPSELAHINSRQLGQKLQGSAPRQQFKVSAITFQDEHMRVTFDSGAYVDFDLSALGHGEERNFKLGVQSVSVTSTSEGYILEVDGMRLFHPKTSFPAAS